MPWDISPNVRQRLLSLTKRTDGFAFISAPLMVGEWRSLRPVCWRQREGACTVPHGDRRAALACAALALRSSVDPATLRYMTAQHHEPPVPDRPAETPAAIRAALAANASSEVLRQYDAELDAAFAQARETGDLTVLITAVRRWWIEALEWRRDPAGQRAFLARMERYVAEGPPGPAHRITREEFRAQFGV